MPTESTPDTPSLAASTPGGGAPAPSMSSPDVREQRHPVASRRILRMALGVALCLVCSQAIGWPLAFLAPMITALVLGLPMPAPSLRQSIVFTLALLSPMVFSLGLLPLLHHARWAGVLMLGLALFHTFLFTARGGPAVIGNFMTVGLTLVVTIGSVAPALLPLLLPALATGVVCGFVFVSLAHALLPDPPADPAPGAGRRKAPTAEPPDPIEARRSALRSLCIVFPLALVFLCSSASTSYTAVMIKVAAVGQQATAGDTRAMARSLLLSTFWGGIAAIVCWQVLSIWPSLLLYALLIALASLIIGRFIFAGRAMHPQASTASYALVTLLIVLGPAVGDGPTSSGAGAAFWSRLMLFVLVAVYGSLSVTIFDAFVPSRAARRMVQETSP
jgi:uncharacterized membrane protein YccC